jgi:hypothetical protein
MCFLGSASVLGGSHIDLKDGRAANHLLPLVASAEQSVAQLRCGIYTVTIVAA